MEQIEGAVIKNGYNNPKMFIVHHAASSQSSSVKDIDLVHKERFGEGVKSSLGWYVGYHYVIDRNGVITKCRKDYEEGAHCLGMNQKSVGICLIGNFNEYLPTPQQTVSLRELIYRLSQELKIDWRETYPHRKFANKDCYGLLLSDSWARDIVAIKYGNFREKLSAVLNNSNLWKYS